MMTPFQRYGINTKWELIIMIVASWLLGIYCTYQITHAVRVHSLDTQKVMTIVAQQMERSSERNSVLLERFKEVETEQRRINQEQEDMLERYRVLLSQLRKAK